MTAIVSHPVPAPVGTAKQLVELNNFQFSSSPLDMVKEITKIDQNMQLVFGASFLNVAVVAGAAAGAHTVTGINTTDNLVAVLQLVGAATTMTNIVNLTSQFTISATNTINNTSGTSTTSDKLLVVWTKNS